MRNKNIIRITNHFWYEKLVFFVNILLTALKQVRRKVECRGVARRTLGHGLKSAPASIADTDLEVIAVVWISIRKDLPVHPRNTSCGDAIGPILNILVAGVGVEDTAGWAIVVLGVEVACTPLLEDQLLAGVQSPLNVWFDSVGREVAYAVGVDCDNVEGSTVEPAIFHGFIHPALSSGGDKDLEWQS